MIWNFRRWLFWKFVRWYFVRQGRSVKIVANRLEYEATTPDGFDARLILRNPAEPDGYSREEVYEMLARVRESEIRMKWKCPEPYGVH